MGRSGAQDILLCCAKDGAAMTFTLDKLNGEQPFRKRQGEGSIPSSRSIGRGLCVDRARKLKAWSDEDRHGLGVASGAAADR